MTKTAEVLPVSIETLQLLRDAEWEEIGPKLVAFAEYWMAGHGGAQLAARGFTGEDIAHTVVEKAWSGERRWDPQRGPLYPWLCAQVKSEISNLVGSAKVKRETLAPRPSAVDEDSEVDRFWVVSGENGAPADQDPEARVAEKDRQEAVQQRWQVLWEAVADRVDLTEVLEAVIEGCEPKPRFLVEYLGVPVKDVNNRLRAIRRRAERIEGGR